MKFCYTYDNMERLLTATVERDGTGPVLLCGNTLDELSLSHDGNQLRRVTDQCAGLAYEGAMDFRDGADAATEYTYDACGNMTSDLNKGITGISYNVLNLPEEVRFADGHVTRYTWAADGRKLRVEYLVNSMAALEPVVGPPGTIARVQSAGLAMPGMTVKRLTFLPTSHCWCATTALATSTVAAGSSACSTRWATATRRATTTM